MCIATRCTTVDQFVDMFHRFVDEDSFFVSTVNTRPPGLETAFSVQLADGTPVLRGQCVVLQAWTSATSPFKTPGVRLGIKRLTASSMPVFERLLVTRSKPVPPPIPPEPKTAVVEQPTQVLEAKTTVAPSKIAAPPQEQRTPGSDLVLPANPLMNLSDESLEGYVDCTLYEETANFFPADDDGLLPLGDLIEPPPPVLAPRSIVAKAPRPVEVMADEPPADAQPMSEHSFAGELPTMSQMVPLPTAPSAATPPVVPSLQAMAAMPVAMPPPPPAFASRDSAPAGEVTMAVRAYRPPGNRRAWIAAGIGLAAAAALATTVIAATSGDDEAPAARPAANVETVTRVAPPPVELPPAPPAPEPEENAAAPEPVVPSEPADAVAGEGPCRVEVSSTPAGSMVVLDGKTIAPSPVTIATTCARHKVDLKHPRYQLGSKFIALEEGTPGKIDITLQRPTHTVSITSQPANATVFINGKRAGTTPTKLRVLGFVNVKLELKKTGYATVSTKLYSKVAQDKLAVKLTKW